LLPTHIRVVLFREGYPKLSYTVPRATSFEELKALVDADPEVVSRGGSLARWEARGKGRVFGPGVRLCDLFGPSTAFASHGWE
jgi:hypothetical protein